MALRKKLTEQELAQRVFEAAWLHFERGYSQKQIAARMKVNAATITRYLQTAVQSNVVQFHVTPHHNVALELQLIEEFRLRIAKVIPSLPMEPANDGEKESDDDATRRSLQYEHLGRAAAEVVAGLITGDSAIGLGGGTGVTAFVRHFPASCPDVALRLLALAVSSREPFAISASSVTAVATSLITAEFQRRAAVQRMKTDGKRSTPPLVQGDALRLPGHSGQRSSLQADAKRYYDDAMRELSLIVTGIGAIESCWILDEHEREAIRNRGGVGDILYDVYGTNGASIAIDAKASVFPFGIPRLRKLVAEGKQVIAICSGKSRAIYHALATTRNPFVTGLVTDELTARAIIDLKEQSGDGGRGIRAKRPRD